MERQGGCHLVNNDEATGELLFGLIRQLMKDRELIKQMVKNLGRIFVDNAALRIIGGIEHGLS
ncbi:MAG: hypothetical protein EG828_14945 [Deltaproteobacteria bacterium]|nr:hypothetical protein [Deltaproteobacteria bacterium]